MNLRQMRSTRQGCFCILSHNINSLSNHKLQNCMDVLAEENNLATPIVCLQETKIATISPPAGMRVEHNPWQGKKGGGLATLVPTCTTILETRQAQYVFYTQVAVEAGVVLYVLNVYIPPTSSDPDQVIWDQIMSLVDMVPPSEPMYLLGDFNAHVLGALSLPSCTCPCHGHPLHAAVTGSTSCGRG